MIELVAIMERCSLRDAGLKLASWFGVETSTDRPEIGESAPETSDAVPTESQSRFGIYEPLGEWIEDRLNSGSPTRFEEAAYVSVLGRIEELADV